MLNFQKKQNGVVSRYQKSVFPYLTKTQIVLMGMLMFGISFSIFYDPNVFVYASGISLGPVDNIMNTIVTLIGAIAKYIGAIIGLWGIIQIVLGFRREDSEAISKNITVVIVGAVLIGIGVSANALYGQFVGSGQ